MEKCKMEKCKMEKCKMEKCKVILTLCISNYINLLVLI